MVVCIVLGLWIALAPIAVEILLRLGNFLGLLLASGAKDCNEKRVSAPKKISRQDIKKGATKKVTP